MHVDFAADEKGHGHQCRYGRDDGHDSREVEGVLNLLPGCYHDADGEKQWVGHGSGKEAVDSPRPLLN
ncbi:hypothetical protein D3C78_1888890 [compost metagenome]